MARRGNSEGSIYKRKDGRWAAAVSQPGAKRQTLYGKTRQEVAKKLTGALRDKESGFPVVSERQTVEQFLNQWLDAAQPTVRHTTYVRYEEYVRLHINPIIGRLRLNRLTPQQVQNLYAKKLADGMSPTSVRHLHTVLHRALRQALRWGLTGRNVTEAVDPPRRAHFDHQPLTPDQARQFLSAAQGNRLEALYGLALTTGMRQGELLGLSWRDVDLDIGTIQVRSTLQQGGVLGEPKTPKSRRRINLPAMAVEALRKHRILQLKERMEAGSAWVESGFTFTNTVGNHVDADNLRLRSFSPLLERAGLPTIRFHDLRHTSATLLLSLGTNPKVVQELLGHSGIAVTMDVYSHVLPTMQQEAMSDMDKLLSA